MSANPSNIANGFERAAKRLSALANDGGKYVEQAVKETTLLAHEAIVDKITSEIEPHSGLHRKNNPQDTVTDLVDTGHYRQSWVVSFPGRFTGVLSTNVPYAPVLEYGTEDGSHQPFYVARDTARKMRQVFRRKIVDGLRKFNT